jgi:mycoredoxin
VPKYQWFIWIRSLVEYLHKTLINLRKAFLMNKSITIYGTYWCGDCIRARRFFDRNNLAYKWVDIDHDESGEEYVLLVNQGMRSVPTICFEDGSVLVEPDDSELKQILRTIQS